MNCREFSIVIGDYVNRTLGDETMKVARMHVDNCAVCASRVAELEATSSMIKSLGRTAAPAGFEERLKARLAAPRHEAQTGVWANIQARLQLLGRALFGAPGHRTVLRPTMAALLCILVAGSLFIWGPRHSSVSETDWTYIDTMKNQHASFAGANPLADESAAALRERATDMHEAM